MTQRIELTRGKVNHYIFTFEELTLLKEFFGLKDFSEILAYGLGYPWERASGYMIRPDSSQMASDIEAELRRLEIPLHRVFEGAPYKR